MLSSAGNAMEMTKMAMYLSGTCREIELGCQSSENPWLRRRWRLALECTCGFWKRNVSGSGEVFCRILRTCKRRHATSEPNSGVRCQVLGAPVSVTHASGAASGSALCILMHALSARPICTALGVGRSRLMIIQHTDESPPRSGRQCRRPQAAQRCTRTHHMRRAIRES